MTIVPAVSRRVCRVLQVAAAVVLSAGASGCILGNRPNFVHTGSRPEEITFYLDGAGNYGFGKESVPLGLADGGYKGRVEHYIWTTYLGPLLDQVWLNHNQREGRGLARRIEEHLRKYPGGHVNIIALSAGTGVAVFALEALQPGYNVDNVVLLSSSLSANYDLTRALRRVNGAIYFFWSPDDPVLQGVVPIFGTVDREYDSSPAGTWGAKLPRRASDETRELYRNKVRNRRWSPDQISGPLKLQHAGSINRNVIRTLVAPILVAKPPTSRPAAVPPRGAPTPPAGSSHGQLERIQGREAAVLRTRPAPSAVRP